MKLFLGITSMLFLAACGAPPADRQEPPPLIPSRPSPATSSAPTGPAAVAIEPLVAFPLLPKLDATMVEELKVVPFKAVTREDSSIDRGEKSVTREGAEGRRTLVYEVITIDGKEISRKVVSDVVTTPPVDEVTTIGTRVASSCDSNYSGCVPIASDVDCAGGRGNGPAYVRGPVNVRGSDIYGLDGDGDGVGCE